MNFLRPHWIGIVLTAIVFAGVSCSGVDTALTETETADIDDLE